MYEIVYHGFLLGILINMKGYKITSNREAGHGRESYLFDVCIIYAMISFLAVVVLTKIYEGAYQERKLKGNLEREETDDEEDEEGGNI